MINRPNVRSVKHHRNVLNICITQYLYLNKICIYEYTFSIELGKWLFIFNLIWIYQNDRIYTYLRINIFNNSDDFVHYFIVFEEKKTWLLFETIIPVWLKPVIHIPPITILPTCWASANLKTRTQHNSAYAIDTRYKKRACKMQNASAPVCISIVLVLEGI